MKQGKIQYISETCFTLHSSVELFMTIPNPKRKVLKHLKYVISWDFFSTSPEFDILLRSRWHHVFRHLMFCFRSSFLADKEANNNLLCQGTRCSLPVVTAEFPTSSELPVFWPLYFTVYKAKHALGLMHRSFFSQIMNTDSLFMLFLRRDRIDRILIWFFNQTTSFYLTAA